MKRSKPLVIPLAIVFSFGVVVCLGIVAWKNDPDVAGLDAFQGEQALTLRRAAVGASYLCLDHPFQKGIHRLITRGLMVVSVSSDDPSGPHNSGQTLVVQEYGPLGIPTQAVVMTSRGETRCRAPFDR